MGVSEAQLVKTAGDIVKTLEKLDELFLTHRHQCDELGRGTLAGSEGGPLHHQRVGREQRVVAILGLPSLRLDKYGSIKSRAFFHGARLAGLPKPLVKPVEGIPLARQPEIGLKTRF